MPDEFGEFLGSGDLSTWARCAGALVQRAGGASARGEDVRKAIFTCIYTCWLSRISGDLKQQSELDEALARLAGSALRVYTRDPASAETRLAVGALMAWRGYHAHAEGMLRSAGALTPEAAILVMPEADTRRVLFLRRAGLHELDPPFVPALFFYGDALLKLRSLSKVEKLLKDHPSLASNPFMLDLQGRLHEDTGRWSDAYETYSHPQSWPKHRYRRSIAASISDRRMASSTPPYSALEGDSQPELEIDASMAAELRPGSYEIDSAELARRNLFVSACRWKAPDHWVVQLELGHLNFRRRRHVAAHANYRAAAAACPPAARFVVLDTQFANLTWLSHASEHVSMAPETYECGHAAIQAAGNADKKAAATTQMWLAATTRDPRDLQLVFDEGDAYTKGRAYSMIGEKGQAIRCWIEAIAESHQPRAVIELINVFVRCRFAHTVGFLVDLTLRESPDDFQVVRELGSCLLSHRKAPGFDDARIDEWIHDVFRRIDGLSRHEFQHLYRVHELLLEAGRQSRALTFLAQAGALAEGPEESLAVATARRELLGVDDSVGLRCLQRAVRESGTRFERLGAAVECFKYGQIRRGRRLLESVGLLDANSVLEPAEYVLAIRCVPWLGKDEANALAGAAITTLRRNVDRGVYLRYEHLFRDRLRQALSGQRGVTVADDLVEWLAHKVASPDSPTTVLVEIDGGTSRVAETLSDAPLHLKLHFWWHVRMQLDEFVANVLKTRPMTDPVDTPISKVTRIEDDLRAQEVSEDWRDYFHADGDSERQRIRGKIKAFYERETELLDTWDQKRRQDAKTALERALYLNTVAEPILEALRNLPERESCWPMLEGFFDSIAYDAQRQLEVLAERAGWLHEEFAVTTAGGGDAR